VDLYELRYVRKIRSAIQLGKELPRRFKNTPHFRGRKFGTKTLSMAHVPEPNNRLVVFHRDVDIAFFRSGDYDES
jgi:hypothetical protein